MLRANGRELVQEAASREPVDLRILSTRREFPEAGVLSMHQLLQRGRPRARADRRVGRIEHHQVRRMALKEPLDRRAIVRDPDLFGDQVVEDRLDQGRTKASATLVGCDLGVAQDALSTEDTEVEGSGGRAMEEQLV